MEEMTKEKMLQIVYDNEAKCLEAIKYYKLVRPAEMEEAEAKELISIIERMFSAEREDLDENPSIYFDLYKDELKKRQ